MGEFRSRVSVSILATGLAGVALVSMVADRRSLLDGSRDLPFWAGAVLDIAVPVQKMVALPIDMMRDSWRDYVALVDVREENGELRERLARLDEANLQLREALVASGRLDRIALMREDFDVPMLPAELVGVDVSPWFHSVLLDRGRNKGVRSGMPVVSETGLAGLVTATSMTAARGMLLLDRQSAVDGTVQRSRARGIVRGTGGDRLEFEFVARGSNIHVGDVIITSGLGGVYPKGLRIGRVTEISDPGSRLLQKATLEPAVDFGRLEQVFIMLRRGPTMELLHGDEEGDTAAAPSGPRS
jgi:rod shape-determining protein MreC